MSNIMDYSFGYKEIILSTVFLLFLHTFIKSKRGQPWEWPIVGMIPMTIASFRRTHDKFTELLEENGRTFVLKGIWFTNSHKVITSDPENAHYVLGKNFSNYEKGEESKMIFDVLGDVLFNADHDEWKRDRKMVRAFFNDRRYIQATVKLVHDGLVNGLIPVLENVCEKGELVDLQDLFTRLMLDSTCTLATGYNPCSLCVSFPEIPLAMAMDIANDTIFLRHTLPRTIRRLVKWLGIGPEKKIAHARKILDDIATQFIKKKKEDIEGKVEGFDALKFFMAGDEASGSKGLMYNVLRDLVVVLNSGGRDTTSSGLSWFFWLLLKNPIIKSKIRKELESIVPEHEAGKFRLFSIEELNKLPYIHGAFCESMRLYPPAPYQQRVAVQSDTLPSGHHIHQKMEIIFSWYALGRMKSIWGDDAHEFKPERWISEKGEFKYDMANKSLFVFSTGPRVCPGKNDAFTRMKAIASTIVYNYDVKLIDTPPVTAAISIILRMKDGLMVNISKRWT